MSYNSCKDIHKFGNKYLPSAYKTQVDFRSHFSGKKVRLIVREIQYIFCVAEAPPNMLPSSYLVSNLQCITFIYAVDRHSEICFFNVLLPKLVVLSNNRRDY